MAPNQWVTNLVPVFQRVSAENLKTSMISENYMEAGTGVEPVSTALQ